MTNARRKIIDRIKRERKLWAEVLNQQVEQAETEMGLNVVTIDDPLRFINSGAFGQYCQSVIEEINCDLDPRRKLITEIECLRSYNDWLKKALAQLEDLCASTLPNPEAA